MSSQQDFYENYVPYILYYCNVVNNDPVVHDLGLVDVCTVDTNSLFQTVYIYGWLLSYSAPSNATLLAYNKSIVNAWCDNFYVKPAELAQKQPYMITAGSLAAVRVDASMTGFSVLETTSRKVKMYNGTVWVDSSMTVASVPQTLDMGTTQSVNLSVAANVTRMVDVPGFVADTQTSDFKFDPLTGKATYIGTATRVADVAIQYTTTKNLPVVPQNLLTWVAKNGATLIPGKRAREMFPALALALADAHTVTRSLSMSTGDTVQLAQSYSATGTVAFSDVGVKITMV